ncbi:MAG: PEGA domain-containing protein, partial [Myxococcaceae bacterium]|nr:PEGA domain-containing protein [Myxococcaceae bacterium]
MQETKARGDAAMLAGRPADALKDYDEALALKPDPALFYNKARALQALERYPEALQHLETFAEKAAPELRARVPRLDSLLTELRTKSSALEIRCSVPGAEVRVADTVIGTTPLAGRLVRNTGQVTVVVTHPDHHRWERVIDLPPAGVAVVDVTLNPKATTGLLHVRASVPGASLTIDETPRGTVPFEDYLPLGTHLLHVTADGFEPLRSSVVIGAVPRAVDLELQRTPRLYERWTFWVVIGAVVAAGVGVGLALA